MSPVGLYRVARGTVRHLLSGRRRACRGDTAERTAARNTRGGCHSDIDSLGSRIGNGYGRPMAARGEGN